ncbi:uncharacterized protein LOC117289136 isoform X5 [Asterias rubens]|uniref:uncharacterized protein LOC117289136 isoform X5 n=1 Tax=Asterias rubens TaxID=7604 RepID=UPI0014559D54|nr:uncharacterized protein LOC117289136 isoform X5 [Asterias rubens]
MISITQTAHCMYMVWYFNLALFYELSKCVISSYLYFSMANAKWCLICDRQIKATKYMSLDFASATLKREPAFLDFLGDMVGDEIDIFAPHMSQYMCGTCHLMVMKCINVKTLQETIRYKFHKTTAKHILSTSSETLLNTALLIPPPCNPPEVDLLRAKVAQRKALESPRTPLPRKDDQQDDGQSVESFNVKIENSVSHETDDQQDAGQSVESFNVKIENSVSHETDDQQADGQSVESFNVKIENSVSHETDDQQDAGQSVESFNVKIENSVSHETDDQQDSGKSVESFNVKIENSVSHETDDQQHSGKSVESFNVKIENSVSHETHEGRPKTVKKDKCAAFGCTHKKSKSRCAFYSFPRYSKANKKWIKASRCNLSKDGFTKKKNFSSRNLRLCECHFARVPYPRSSSQRLKNIAPTLFNFLAADFKASSKPVKRVKRIPIMSAKPLEKPTSPENNCRPSFYQQMKHFLSKEAYDAVDSCAPSFWKTYHQLEKEVMTLKATCNSTTVLSLQNIKCNDRVFETYTGLPNYATFEVLCGYMAMNASCLWRFKALPFGELTVIDTNNVNRQTLTIEDQLFLFLVAVRTGSSSKDLAIRFSISERLVNNIISSWAVFVSDTLEKFYNTTVTKKAKFNVAVDYTALFSESPALLTTQQNETTINRRLIAVGFSRYGVVTSVLSTKRGHALARVSTTHNEGTDSASKQPSSLGPVKHEQGTKILPSSSQPGDVSSLVITEDLSKSHMTPMSTAEVFHVERALNRIKQFHYLQKQVEPSMEDMYEQVFKACAFLVNFQSVS